MSTVSNAPLPFLCLPPLAPPCRPRVPGGRGAVGEGGRPVAAPFTFCWGSKVVASSPSEPRHPHHFAHLAISSSSSHLHIVLIASPSSPPHRPHHVIIIIITMIRSLLDSSSDSLVLRFRRHGSQYERSGWPGPAQRGAAADRWPHIFGLVPSRDRVRQSRDTWSLGRSPHAPRGHGSPGVA